MKNKVAFIVSYYGKFPNYFNLFLQSCRNNPEYTWIIFTDDATKYNYPENVIVHMENYGTFQNRIHQLDASYAMGTPNKICDYRPLFGLLYRDELKNYSHWGLCDIDVIWGDLSRFITDELLNEYSKLFIWAHCTILKNNDEVNNAYKLPYSGIAYKKIFSKKAHFGFDENKGINLIWEDNNLSLHKVSACADINYLHYPLTISNSVNEPGQMFKYENGHIFQLHNDGTVLKEWMYIHLQKRKMAAQNFTNANSFYINEDNFSLEAPAVANNCAKKRKFEFQARVKYYKVRLKWDLAWKLEWAFRKPESKRP